MRIKSVSILAALCSCCLFASLSTARNAAEASGTTSDAGAHCRLHFHFAYMGTDNRQEETFEVAVADFDGDGHVDFAAPLVLSGTLYVYHGHGDGKFDPPVIYPSGGYVESIVTADFNNDGKPDLAEAIPSCCGGTGVHIFLNDGNGGFLPSVLVYAGVDPEQVVAADFNQDGNLDLAVPEFETGSNLVLLGDGHGGFGAPISSPGGGGWVVAGDFNGDGIPDLAEADSQLKILLGDGAGGFTVAHTYSFGPGNPTHLATADFDHNGTLDLAVGVINENAQVYTYLGDGTGAFVSSVGLGEDDAQGVMAIDADGDGNIDIVTADYSGDSISVARGNGHGHFAPIKHYGLPRNPNALPINIGTGDFNEDGMPDFVTSDYGVGGATVAISHCGTPL